MCDLAPFAVVGSNTIIQVNVAHHLDHDHDDYVNHADQNLKTKNLDISTTEMFQDGNI